MHTTLLRWIRGFKVKSWYDKGDESLAKSQGLTLEEFSKRIAERFEEPYDWTEQLKSEFKEARKNPEWLQIEVEL